jgi:hypothetical protein
VSVAVAQSPRSTHDPYAFLIPQFGTRAVHWSRRETTATRAT